MIVGRDGLNVGVGATVGDNEGFLEEGLLVGCREGTRDGRLEGCLEGSRDGCDVGTREGREDGCLVGSIVG